MTLNVKSLPTKEEVDKIMDAVDWALLDKIEGGVKSEAYTIPKDPRSGVTAAGHVDLGQHVVKDLLKMGVDPTVVKKLAPYTGLKGKAAESYLKRHPLLLKPEETKHLDYAAKRHTAQKVATEYQGRSGKNFSELPTKVQTAVVSLMHNVGIRGAPKSMAQLIQGNLQGLAKEITNFKDKRLASRRKIESQLVLDAIRELEALGG